MIPRRFGVNPLIVMLAALGSLSDEAARGDDAAPVGAPGSQCLGCPHFWTPAEQEINGGHCYKFRVEPRPCGHAPEQKGGAK